MGTIKTYFSDTYAFFEIFKNNPRYNPYKKGVAIITTKLNLMELHYGILLAKGRDIADGYYDRYEKYAVSFDSETVKKANRLKADNRKKKMSYIDCVGYTLAKLRNVKFLTGDKAFEGLENVEFVK